MEFRNYQTLSVKTKNQIDQIVDVWRRHLENSLIGVYLHGSLALNSFVEGVSDIDALIVCDRHIGREERLRIVKDIILIDGKPSSLEMSAIWTKDLKPWKHPTPCQFHYSEYWTSRYLRMLSGEIHESFMIDEDFCDSDIACHVRLTNQCGLCAYGAPVKETFPDVPEQDFWKSLISGIDEYDFHAGSPRSFVSNILILGRVLSYKKEKRILSKYEAGVWALRFVPEKYRYIIKNAIGVWYLGGKPIEYRKEDLDGLRAFLIAEIKEPDARYGD